jgi:DNA polymerase-1
LALTALLLLLLLLLPAQVADFKALSGDSSDNLPGVPGIGPKTAAELLAKHGTLDGVFQHLEDNKPGVVKKLTGQEELARMFRELVLLRWAVLVQPPV